MLVPNRHASTPAYRYGFNGKEKDDELKGEGNSLDFGARMLDPRVGRWFAPDPVIQPYESPYSYAANNPIFYVDSDGKDNIVYLVILPSAQAKLGKEGMEAIRKEMQQRLKDLGLVTEVKIFDDGGSEFDSRNLDRSDSFVVLGSLNEIKKEVKGSERYKDLNKEVEGEGSSAIDSFTGVSGNSNRINPENSANNTSDTNNKAGKFYFASGILVDLETLDNGGTVFRQLQTNRENRFAYFAIHGLAHNTGFGHNTPKFNGGFMSAEYDQIVKSIGVKIGGKVEKAIEGVNNIEDVFNVKNNEGFRKILKTRLNDKKNVTPRDHYQKNKKDRTATNNKRS